MPSQATGGVFSAFLGGGYLSAI
ncbi:hypothetical protein EMIT051CA3_100228 [Pseudomonas chlororaphis]